MRKRKKMKERRIRKKKLVIFHYAREYGGADVFIENIVPALQQEYDVVLATVYPARRLKSRLKIKSYQIPVKNMFLFFGFFHFIYMLLRERVNILFVQGLAPSVYARFFQLIFFRMRQVAVIHANIGHFRYKLPFAQGIIKRLNRLTCVLVDKFVCVSEDLARHLIKQGVLERQIRVIYNGIRSPEMFPRMKTAGHPRIAFIGRLSPEKGVDNFLKLAQQAIDANEKAEFHVFGAGQYAGEVKNMHALYPHQLYYHGFVADVFKQFYIDVLVMPSRDEGLPFAALEAMAYGIPLVAFRVGGLGEIIDNNENGILCEPGDVTSLHQAVLELTKNAHLRGKLAINAKKTAKTKFDLGQMQAKYLNILRTGS